MSEEENITQNVKFEGDKPVLFKAMVQAQKNMGEVIKNASNPAFRSKYADLSSVVEAVTPPFNDAGFYVLQNSSYIAVDKILHVETYLLHESGGYIEAHHYIPVTKFDAQGIGSATTYGRRYALQSIAGVAPEDDDGNAASAKQEKPKVKQEPRKEIVYSPTAHKIQDEIKPLKTIAAVCDFFVQNNDKLKANTHYDSICDYTITHCRDLISGLDDLDLIQQDKNFNEENLSLDDAIPFGEDIINLYRERYKQVKQASNG